MRNAADILLVEDDEDLSEVLADLLTECGYQVATASHGLAALGYLEANPLPSLILLDWMMPVMDGEEFCRQKAESPAIADVPVFLLSARGDPPISPAEPGGRALSTSALSPTESVVRPTCASGMGGLPVVAMPSDSPPG